MNNPNQLCVMFYNAFMIPIHCYQNGESFYHFPKTGFETYNLLELFNEYAKEETAIIHTDNSSLFWAKIKVDDTEVLIGPITTTTITDRIVTAYMTQHYIEKNHFAEVKQLLTMAPRLTLTRFISVVQMLYNLFTNKSIDSSAIVLGNMLFNPENLTDEETNMSIADTLASQYEDSLEMYEISYKMEQQMLKNMETGNIPAIVASFKENDASGFGSTAESAFRNIKNIFIVIITNASRCAIRNGVSVKTAFALSDQYIREIELSYNYSDLVKITSAAVVDYTTRIQELKFPNDVTPITFKAIQYIESSLNMPLSVSDVAAEVGKSVSYLSAIFKNETGMNISSFITKTKIDEAKRLLAKTDIEIILISNFLCYSSQSHFQNTFKKETGMTPLQYRKKHNKTI